MSVRQTARDVTGRHCFQHWPLRMNDVANFRFATYDVHMEDDDSQCPRCRATRLRHYAELSADEREVVKRLPASADYDAKEREARHRWCIQCWYEDKGRASRNI